MACDIEHPRLTHKIAISFMVGCTALILGGAPALAYGEEAAAMPEGSAEPVAASALDAASADPALADSATAAPAARAATASAASASAFAGGTGTADDPFRIATAEQLEAFRDSVNSGQNYQGQTIVLTADVTLPSGDWTPIGAGTRRSAGYTAESTPFAGTFDGQGHTVPGLTITQTQGADYAIGFFGILENATVENVSFANADVDVPESELAGICAGLMVNDSTVSNVTTSGSVSAKCGAGGVVGRMTVGGTISQCSNGATVATSGGTGNAGGIVGAAYYTQPGKKMVIEGCSNSASVTGADAVGGIAGLSAAFVSDCENSGAVTADTYGAGGIVGDQKNYGAVDGCTNSGAVTLTSASGYGCGGIVGWARYDGAASAYAATAPISVTNNDNSGAIKGGNDAGGIVGTFYSAGTVTGNQNSSPSITSHQFAGGIVGNLQDQGQFPDGVTVPTGITVANNVSTTADSALSAPLKNAYAYNNDPSQFTVKDNGTAWQADAAGQRYVTPAFAVASAADGDTVSLLGDVPASDAITVDGGRNISFNLNGHNLAFRPDAGFVVTDGQLTVLGQGDVLAAQPQSGAQPTALFQVAPAQGKTAAALLKSGNYSQDVARFAAPSYAELVADSPDADGAEYQILPHKEAEAQASAEVKNPDGTTVYYEDEQAAKDAAAAQSGAVEEPVSHADGGTSASDGEAGGDEGDDANGTGADASASEDADGAAVGQATAESGAASSSYHAASYSKASSLPRMGDQLAIPMAAGAFAAVAAAALAVVALRRVRSSRL